MANPNPFDILGVSPNSTDSQVKHAYLKLIKKYHPDVNKSKDATQRTQEIVHAYQALKTKQKRQAFQSGNPHSNRASSSQAYTKRYAYESKKRPAPDYPFARSRFSRVKGYAHLGVKIAAVSAIVYVALRMAAFERQLVTGHMNHTLQNSSGGYRPPENPPDKIPRSAAIPPEPLARPDPKAPLKPGDLVDIRQQNPLIVLGKAGILEINQDTVTVTSRMDKFTFVISNIVMVRHTELFRK